MSSFKPVLSVWELLLVLSGTFLQSVYIGPNFLCRGQFELGWDCWKDDFERSPTVTNLSVQGLNMALTRAEMLQVCMVPKHSSKENMRRGLWICHGEQTLVEWKNMKMGTPRYITLREGRSTLEI